MSSKAAKYYRSVVTVWRKGDEDEFGRVAYSAPVRVKASYKVGVTNSYPDSRGVEFTPDSIAWTEFRDADGVLRDPPKQDDILFLGESFDNTPPDGSYNVRKIITHDNTILDGPNSIPDYEVMTSA